MRAEARGGLFVPAHLRERPRGGVPRLEIRRVERPEPHDDLRGAGLVAAGAPLRRDRVQLRLRVGQQALLLRDVRQVQLRRLRRPA